MFKKIVNLLIFELKLACLHSEGVWGGVLYFLMTLIIMPFTLNVAEFNLAQIAPTIIWVAIIPAILTSTSRLFITDVEDGFIDRYMLMDMSFEMIFVIKILTIVISVIVPLLLITPISALLFSMSFDSIIRLYVGLLVSLPAIVFFAGFGALLSLQGRMGHVLTYVIVIPLIIPAIILGAGIVYTEMSLYSVIKLPIIFSLISVLITTPASGYLYKQIYYC